MLHDRGLRAAYRPEYMEQNKPLARESARRIVPIVNGLVHPASVLDVGCGTGSWLAVFQGAGVRDILGIDGPWIDREALEIPADRFIVRDLEQPLDLGRRFDLALSLEVGEHLAPGAADRHVDSLTRHASAILFSAAIPMQGGSHHTNERWPSYWAERFRTRGFEPVDCVRPAVWDRPEVAWWYAQNTILYVERSTLDHEEPLRQAMGAGRAVPLDLVHPCKFLQAADTDRLRRKELMWLVVNWFKHRSSVRARPPALPRSP